MKTFVKNLIVVIVIASLSYCGYEVYQFFAEMHTREYIIERLKADTRMAEVIVTESSKDSVTQKIQTTIKFLEYSAEGNPLKPRYFTFSDNIIQFQSLVIRFNDALVERGDPVFGKSACVFLKAFSLDGDRVESYSITEIGAVPEAYAVEGKSVKIQKRVWDQFWTYIDDPDVAGASGIRNAQIEAPGTYFRPGMLYTLSIEHDGGIRIDQKKLPDIIADELSTNRPYGSTQSEDITQSHKA